jgi:tRNA(Arg) A34 adenosine deaminase TadA
MIDRPTMDLAIDVARSSPSKKKVGAILLNKGKVVSKGVNKETKSHPLQAKFAEMVGLGDKIYLHAEISALVNNRSDCDTIVVARLGGYTKEELRNSKPCPICSLALQSQGIEHIYYTTDKGFHYHHNK